jgi:hypothetical protein
VRPHSDRPDPSRRSGPSSLFTIRLVLLIGACILATSIVRAQLTEGFPLDTARIIGPDYTDIGTQTTAFAPGDSMGIVVWYKWACRILADGTVLDSIPILADSADYYGEFDVGSADGSFVFVHTGRPGDPEPARLTTVHISRSGQVVERTVIDSLHSQCGSPALGSDGEKYLLAWAGEQALLYVRLDSAGRPLDSAPRTLSTPEATSAYDVDFAYGESTYLAVWVQGRAGWPYEALARLVHRDGTILGDPIRLGKPRGNEPVAATYDGHNFVALWCDGRGWLLAGRITESGRLLDPNGVVVESTRMEKHDVCTMHDTTLVCWVIESGDTGYIRARRFDTALVAMDSTPIDISPPAIVPHTATIYPSSPTLAGAGGNFICTWSQPWLNTMEANYGNSDVVLRRLTPGGQLLDSACIVVSNSANAQIEPSVASDGSNFLAVWTDFRPNTPEVYCVRGVLVGPQGRPLGPAFTIGPRRSNRPMAAYGGGCYLIAWSDSADGINAARVSADGVLLDSTPMRVGADHIGIVGVQFAGGVFLVAWPGDGQPQGKRVTPNGQILDTATLLLVLNTESHASTRLASDGHIFMLASHLPFAPRAPFTLVRVDSTGRLLDTQEITIDHQSGGPLLTYGNGLFLLTNRPDRVNWRISPAGVILDSAGIPSNIRSPRASGSDGSDFLLASFSAVDSGRQLWCERVSTDGTLVDSTPFAIVDSFYDIFRSGLCANRLGWVCFVYESMRGPPYSTTRAWAAVLTMPDAIGAAPSAGPNGGLSLWPTLASRSITLEAPSSAVAAVEFYDAIGRLVRRVDVSAADRQEHGLTIDTRDLAPGVYIVRVMPGGTSRRFAVVR